MMANEQAVTAWANAYNAALTGLLASRIHAEDVTGKEAPWVWGPDNLQVIAEQCKAFADRALKDLQQFDAIVRPKR